MKKKLLISWGSPYVFYETMVPLIPKLAKDFSISIILTDFFTSEETLKALESMAADKLIEEYWILPKYKNIFKYYLFIKSKSEIWRKFNFDMFLSISGLLVVDQYLRECVLPKHCIHVCFWTATGYLLRSQQLVKKALEGSNLNHPFILEEKKCSFRQGFISRLFKKIKSEGSFKKAIKMILVTIKARIYSKVFKRMRYYIDRFLLPMVFFRKSFLLSKMDNLTQIALDKADAFIFCDELEAKVFTALAKTPAVYIARYPTQGGCRCEGIQNAKKAVLISLTVGFGNNRNELSEKILSLFYRDIQIVLSKSGAKVAHLRLHPRTEGSWPYQLEKYLRSKGVDTCVVDSRRPIREVMCDYLGLAGCVSSSLKDGRASCEYAFVVGFVGVSKELTPNPRMLFGNSEGIGWIEEDGSFGPAIFSKGKYSPPARKSVDEILGKLINRKEDVKEEVRG